MPCVPNMTIVCLRMHSKCINSISGRKTHWKLIQWDRFPVWRGNFSCPTLLFVYFGVDFSIHMSSFDHITTSRLKSKDISAHLFSYKDAVISGAQHHFGNFCGRIIWARAQYINSTSGRKFQICHRKWIQRPDFI